MTVQSCPNPETLQRLLSGTLTGSEAEQLEAHLLDCEECLAKARSAPGDSLIAVLRSRREFTGEEDILAAAIDRAKQLRSKAETVETDETMTVHGKPPVENVPDSLVDRPSLDEEIDFLAPPQQPDEIGRLGDYRVLDVLGIGGMGVVFLAEDPRLKRQIALKAMKPVVAASRSAKNRFLREAQATAAIEHDHIVQIHQVGEDAGVPFIAMQFLRGESLQKRLQRFGQLDEREVLRIGREVATGLQAAHSRKLVHRDIKPDNLWLEEGTGRVKILDFGLVRTTTDDASLTQSGLVLGTPKYMAPEQAQGEAVDHRSDLFSLGSVLYHLLSGKPPFEGSNLTATLMAVSQAECNSVDELCPNVHPELANLISRLLSKDRDGRPQSAAEVVQLLCTIEEKLDEKPGGQEEQATEQQFADTAELARAPLVRPSQKAQPKSLRPVCFVATVVFLSVALFAWLYAAGILFNVQTEHGTLVVRVTGDDFVTSVQGRKVKIKNTQTGKTYTIDLKSPKESMPLAPGQYKFELSTDSGLKVDADRFTIRSGVDQVVDVSWKTRAVAAREQSNIASQEEPNADGPWVPLITGKDLSGWRNFNTGSIDWTVEESTITGRNRVNRVEAGGAIFTEAKYQDFHFRCEVQTGGPLGGVLFFRNDGSVGQDRRRGYAVVNPSVDSKSIDEGWGIGSLYADDFQVPLSRARLMPTRHKDLGIKPGDWYRLEFIARGPAVEVRVNGKTTAEYTSSDARLTKAGSIGISCSRGAVVTYRNLEIKELKPAKANPPQPAIATFIRGNWTIDADNIEQAEKNKMAMILFGSPEWGDGDFTCEVLRAEGDHGLAIVARATDLQNYYYFDIGVFDNRWSSIYAKEAGSNWRRVDQKRIDPIPTDRWVKLRLRLREEQFKGYIDDQLVLSGKDSRRLKGYIGLRTWNEAGKYRNLKFTDPEGNVLWQGFPEIPERDEADTDEMAIDPDRRAAEYIASVGGGFKTDMFDARFISVLPNGPFQVTGISLERCAVTDASLAALSGCTELKSLNLSWTGITDAGVTYFKDCNTLTDLQLGPLVTDEGLANFQNCTNLQRLTILSSTGKVTDAGLAHFKNCRTLKYLHLHHTKVTGAGLAHFKDAKDLNYLHLDRTEITDAGLAQYKDWKQLATVGLSFVSIGDAGLAHLKDCQKLTSLFLDMTQVTDAGLAHLKQCPNLKSLTIRRTPRVSQAIIDTLKKALPNCQISWDGQTIEAKAADKLD